MTTIELPLDPLAVSIGFGGRNGPAPLGRHTPLFLDFNQLTRELLRQTDPDQVVSWLFCTAYDAHDVAHILTGCGFRGRYRAIAPALPNKAAVAREIRRAFPGLNFDIYCPANLSREVADYHESMAAPGLGIALA
ncbi:hypothetical protein [Marimonas arenosa]|uniref:Uncharacterized protein n=1 Tax=Marimonas arenosa TaxID=1795305 RepID=A0AAE4B2U6_9RHOB|nr:hypothetical protein [Marimonas arenosa]MDQ2088610.1 hypothetical protein [Marimonas arenosa]